MEKKLEIINAIFADGNCPQNPMFKAAVIYQGLGEMVNDHFEWKNGALRRMSNSELKKLRKMLKRDAKISKYLNENFECVNEIEVNIH